MTTFKLDKDPGNWFANLILLLVLVVIAVMMENC